MGTGTNAAGCKVTVVVFYSYFCQADVLGQHVRILHETKASEMLNLASPFASGWAGSAGAGVAPEAPSSFFSGAASSSFFSSAGGSVVSGGASTAAASVSSFSSSSGGLAPSAAASSFFSSAGSVVSGEGLVASDGELNSEESDYLLALAPCDFVHVLCTCLHAHTAYKLTYMHA